MVPVGPQEAESHVDYIMRHCNAKAIITEDTAKWLPSYDPDSAFQSHADCLTIIYTSGTTGQPKGVMLGHQQWKANAEALIAHHGITVNTVIGSPLPLFHCNAHGFAMLTSYMAHCRYVLFDRSSPDGQAKTSGIASSKPGANHYA